jgi:rSAM/selenodomain-associated transferase 1
VKPALVVIAKAPVPGRVKTRLCPPCTPAQAARLARAALQDTLAACDVADAGRRMLALEGEPVGGLPPGWEVVAQRGGGLAERLAGAFDDVGGPALLVGMDTPQLRAAELSRGLRALERADAVLGPATDGGYWAIGLREPDARVFAGVPMSRDDTGGIQRARLDALGLSTIELSALLDVDDIADARAVAAAAPAGRFAAALAAIEPSPAAA